MLPKHRCFGDYRSLQYYGLYLETGSAVASSRYLMHEIQRHAEDAEIFCETRDWHWGRSARSTQGSKSETVPPIALHTSNQILSIRAPCRSRR